jgi:hypothetical protein
MLSSGSDMPRYFFDIKNGHRLPDHRGVDCKDDAAAIEAGLAIARQIAEEVSNPAARHLAIIDPNGREIRAVPIGDPEHVQAKQNSK